MKLFCIRGEVDYGQPFYELTSIIRDCTHKEDSNKPPYTFSSDIDLKFRLTYHDQNLFVCPPVMELDQTMYKVDLEILEKFHETNDIVLLGYVSDNPNDTYPEAIKKLEFMYLKKDKGNTFIYSSSGIRYPKSLNVNIFAISIKFVGYPIYQIFLNPDLVKCCTSDYDYEDVPDRRIYIVNKGENFTSTINRLFQPSIITEGILLDNNHIYGKSATLKVLEDSYVSQLIKIDDFKIDTNLDVALEGNNIHFTLKKSQTFGFIKISLPLVDLSDINVNNVNNFKFILDVNEQMHFIYYLFI